MDLYSGLPYWIVKNELNQGYDELPEKLQIDVAIIGSGITGSLVAHELCAAGIPCAIFDKRSLTTGSTAASTAQLQYEIDIPLHKLIDIRGAEIAVKAYFASLASISAMEQIFIKTKLDTDFKRLPSLYLASNHTGSKALEQEYKTREKYGLPVTFLSDKDLRNDYNIHRESALLNNEAAQMDGYHTAGALLRYNRKKHKLQLYPYTEITQHQKEKDGYYLKTVSGKIISCRYLVIATGFESGQFLPENIMKLTSTYVVISEPIHPELFWKDRCLIWETRNPYFYLRTTEDNRIMIGGEDIPHKNERYRDLLLPHKTERLIKKFRLLFPDKPFIPEMAWCGTFSSTEDALPYIGSYPGDERKLFALGYGGNGITFSMIAAEMITNKIKGIKDEREDIFSFESRNQ